MQLTPEGTIDLDECERHATQPRWLADWQSNEPARMVAALRAVGVREDDARYATLGLYFVSRAELPYRCRDCGLFYNGAFCYVCRGFQLADKIRCLCGDVFAGGVETCRRCKRDRTDGIHSSHAACPCHGTGSIPAPLVIDPRWLSSNVLALAKAVRGEGNFRSDSHGNPADDGQYISYGCKPLFDRLPILADALMDAGCDNEALLEHCREPGPHVGGCWVVRMLLERGT